MILKSIKFEAKMVTIRLTNETLCLSHDVKTYLMSFAFQIKDFLDNYLLCH